MFARAIDFLFPPQCAVCERVGSGLCEGCAPPAGALVPFAFGRLRCVALGRYEGGLRTAVLACKRGRRDVAAELARLAAVRLGASLLKQEVTLVPVPTTKRRRSERGFDQGVLLAEEIARRLRLPTVAPLQAASGDAQHGRSRADRLGAAGRFSCTKARRIAGLAVTVVDDVATTGSTLCDAAATLERAGARVVGGLVIARADEERIASPSSRVQT